MPRQRLGRDLQDIIRDVAASYGAGRLIDSLGTAQLPNKRLVIEALNHLKAVMYLGYYSIGSLDESRVPFAVASHLHPACDILIEQTRRASNYVGFRPPDVSRCGYCPDVV